MTSPRLPPEQRKEVRFTVCVTRALAERVSRAASYAGVSRSEFVEGMLAREVEAAPAIPDEEIEQAEQRRDDWRSRRGL